MNPWSPWILWILLHVILSLRGDLYGFVTPFKMLINMLLQDDYSRKNSTFSKFLMKLIKTPNEMCEANEGDELLLKARRGCFWRETTITFPPKHPGSFQKEFMWVCHRLPCTWQWTDRFDHKPVGSVINRPICSGFCNFLAKSTLKPGFFPGST